MKWMKEVKQLQYANELLHSSWTMEVHEEVYEEVNGSAYFWKGLIVIVVINPYKLILRFTELKEKTSVLRQYLQVPSHSSFTWLVTLL